MTTWEFALQSEFFRIAWLILFGGISFFIVVLGIIMEICFWKEKDDGE